MKSHETCSNCNFFYPLETQCRKNPPTILPLIGQISLILGNQQQIQIMSAWPPVKEAQWCGEFKMKDNEGES